MRKLIFFTVLVIFITQFVKIAKADSNFDTSVNVEYKIHPDGLSTVTNTITIKNKSSDLYSKSFVYYLSNITTNNLQAYEGGERLDIVEQKQDDLLKMEVKFTKSVVGLDKSRTFIITYENNEFAQETGEVWEISIPRLNEINNFNDYSVKLSVPNSLGNEAYMSPEPREVIRQNQRSDYLFYKDDVLRSGISAGYGKFQVFSFKLNYHIENPLNSSSLSQIAVPPDTSIQKVFLTQMDPKPVNIQVDQDGNWLALYELDPREQLNITVKGYVQIYAQPKKYLLPDKKTLDANLKQTKNWQSEDPELKQLALDLKTPKNIYNYVTGHLNYNSDRAKPNAERLGAKEAYLNPDKAICMEFTDLFIALSRAAGIPAREVNGFAYSQNPEIEPLSLVADVLHAWPEYWNEDEKTWIPVDPTWGTKSQGVDYFNKFDLRHFTFVVHGMDDTRPYSPGSYKLGPEPQKDVFVEFAELPEEKNIDIAIDYRERGGLNILSKNIDVTVKNQGPVAIYNLMPQILFSNESVSEDFQPILPPFSNYETNLTIPYGFLSSDAPESVKVKAYRSEIEIPLDKTQIIIYQLSTVFILIFILLFLVGLKMGIKSRLVNMIKK